MNTLAAAQACPNRDGWIVIVLLVLAIAAWITLSRRNGRRS